MTAWARFGLSIAAVLAALIVSVTVPATGAPAPGNCLWFQEPGLNYAFPDSGSAYWTSRFELPAGATLSLNGRFPHARYESLNSYGSDAAPTDAVNDVSTDPDPGSSNPFLAGARRDVRKRSYTVRVIDEPAPVSGQRQRNTLYAGVSGQNEQRLIYRVYVPDRGRDLAGGVGLPRPEVRLADGSVRRGEAACKAIGVIDDRLPLTTLPKPFYDSLRDQPGKPPTFPAEDPPVFGAYYNTSFSIACGYYGQCGGHPQRIGGQYSNRDNNYIAAFVSRGFGHVLVLRGKLPRTPPTLDGERRMGRGQLRYWSICQNESLYTTRGAGCLYDEQVPLDKRAFYTIVTSLPKDRPKNAAPRCGVGFVPWPRRGDGAGHPDDGLLLIRNMLPAASFHHAVQSTKTPGDERRVMGPYDPRGTYMSKAAFERRGCRA